MTVHFSELDEVERRAVTRVAVDTNDRFVHNARVRLPGGRVVDGEVMQALVDHLVPAARRRGRPHVVGGHYDL